MHAALLSLVLRLTDVDGAIRLVMRTSHVAGISVAAAHGDRIIYARGFGYADLGRRIPAAAGTVYRIGSLTKSFTAALAVRFVQQGKLALDAPIAQYVPVPWKQPITIEELLAQTSGIPSYSDSTALSRSGTYTPAQLVDAVAALPLAFEPGTQYAYSNTNYVLLGMALERVGGMPYAQLLQSQLIDPLGLTQTRYGDQPDEAAGYARDTLNSPVPASSTPYAYAAAGMTSNVLDLARWLQNVPAPYYGFLPGRLYGHDVYLASGNVNGYSSFALFDLKDGDRIVVLCNAEALDLQPLAMDVFAAIEPPAPGTRAPTLRNGVRADRNRRLPARDAAP